MTLEDSGYSSTLKAFCKSVSQAVRYCVCNASSFSVSYSIRTGIYEFVDKDVFYSLDMSVTDFCMTKIESYDYN